MLWHAGVKAPRSLELEEPAMKASSFPLKEKKFKNPSEYSYINCDYRI